MLSNKLRSYSQDVGCHIYLYVREKTFYNIEYSLNDGYHNCVESLCGIQYTLNKGALNHAEEGTESQRIGINCFPKIAPCVSLYHKF